VNRRDIIERLLAYFGVGGGVGFGLKIIDKNDTLPIVRRTESNDYTGFGVGGIGLCFTEKKFIVFVNNK
jgi:hypothetical protein